MNRLLPALALLLAAAPLAASAADCLGIGPVGTPARLHEVNITTGHVAFVRNASEHPGCPSEAAECRDPEQLRSGNRVVVGETSGPWSCAVHAETRARRVAGWLPSAALIPVPELDNLRASDWAGRWRGDAERTLRLTTARDGAILLRGADRNIPDEDSGGATPGPTPGEVTARFLPEGSAVRFVLGEDGTTLPDSADETRRCRMALHRQGTFLLVQDNGRCGGTSFTGLYRRGL